MNGIGYAAQGAAAAFMAATKLAAAGGPTINLKMTSGPPQPVATPRKKGRNAIKIARENYESSKKAFLESQQHYRELEAKDRKEKDKFNEIQLELQKLSQEDISIEIRHDAFALRASYAVAGELSGTYVQISKKHILPGVTQVNRLMLTISRDNSGATLADKVKQINMYARKAQSEISAVATERRERIKNQLVDVGRNITEAGEKLEEYANAGYGDNDEIADDEWDDFDGSGGIEEISRTEDEVEAEE
ncbi:MAG: hypothetical protein Q9218_001580 [Villophora microphyllina]